MSRVYTVQCTVYTVQCIVVSVRRIVLKTPVPASTAKLMAGRCIADDGQRLILILGQKSNLTNKSEKERLAIRGEE